MPPSDDDYTDPLAQAHVDRDADIEVLADLDDDQLRYLAEVRTLPDPLTDGLECDEERRSSSSSYSDPSSGADTDGDDPARPPGPNLEDDD